MPGACTDTYLNLVNIPAINEPVPQTNKEAQQVARHTLMAAEQIAGDRIKLEPNTNIPKRLALLVKQLINAAALNGVVGTI